MSEEVVSIQEAVESFGAALSKSVTNWVAKHSIDPLLTVTAPGAYSSLDANGKESKVSLIGGESFKPIGGFLGKRNQPYFVFAPVSPSTYASIMLSKNEVKSIMSGGANFLQYVLNDPATCVALRAIDEAKAEVERMKSIKERGSVYASIGYGSW